MCWCTLPEVFHNRLCEPFRRSAGHTRRVSPHCRSTWSATDRWTTFENSYHGHLRCPHTRYRSSASRRVGKRRHRWYCANTFIVRGKKTVEGQVRNELSERGFPDPISIEVWPQQRLVQQKLKSFVLRRGPKKRQPPAERSWGISITFDQQISGPISLGYASHFGLGNVKNQPCQFRCSAYKFSTGLAH